MGNTASAGTSTSTEEEDRRRRQETAGWGILGLAALTVGSAVAYHQWSEPKPAAAETSRHPFDSETRVEHATERPVRDYADMAFARQQPYRRTHLYETFRQRYRDQRTAFTYLKDGQPHRSPADPMCHVSWKVNCGPEGYYTLHIYIDEDRITKVTAKKFSRDGASVVEPECIAVFGL